MSKSRKIIAVVGGLFIVVYLLMAATYRAVLWPVTGVNEFSFKQMVYNNPQPSAFPEHTMCRMGGVLPGLGWLLGTVYAHPNMAAYDQSVAGNACSYKDNLDELYVKRGSSITHYYVIGTTVGNVDHHIVGHAEQF